MNYYDCLPVNQEQASIVTKVIGDCENGLSCVNLTYFTADPADCENPPPMIEFKFKVPHDGLNFVGRTWHFKWECPNGNTASFYR